MKNQGDLSKSKAECVKMVSLSLMSRVKYRTMTRSGGVGQGSNSSDHPSAYYSEGTLIEN